MDAANTPIPNDPSETSNPSAIYKNHPLGSNETRVIKIMPSTSTDESDLISLQLSVISPDVHPEYVAVSYMWGDPSPTKDILVDGELFAVRLNIWNFLLQKRREQCQDSLWIDSICINQDDPSERGHQVAVMGQIYSKAVEVRVWLGVGTEENWLGMQRLSEVDWSRFHNSDSCQQDTFGSQRHAVGCRICNILPSSMSPDQFVAPALELCKLEYWSRMWIVQEYLLARQLKIQCGPLVIDERTVTDFQSYCVVQKVWRDELWPSTESSENFFGRPTVFNVIRLKNLARWSKGSFWNFWEMLVALRRHQSSDPRDHVYAILSLNQFASENIVPDYTKSIPDLFSAVLALFNFDSQKYGNTTTCRAFIKDLQRALQLSDDCDVIRDAVAAEDLNDRRSF